MSDPETYRLITDLQELQRENMTLKAELAAEKAKVVAAQLTIEKMRDACKRHIHSGDTDTSDLEDALTLPSSNAIEIDRLEQRGRDSLKAELAAAQLTIKKLHTGIKNVQMVWEKEEFGYFKLKEELFSKVESIQLPTKALEIDRLEQRIDEHDEMGDSSSVRLEQLQSQLDELTKGRKHE